MTVCMCVCVVCDYVCVCVCACVQGRFIVQRRGLPEQKLHEVVVDMQVHLWDLFYMGVCELSSSPSSAAPIPPFVSPVTYLP